ncbi:MAG: OmpW family outer membrane protein [Deltaproteobacteria bacterium]
MMKKLILSLTICLAVFAVTEAKSADFDIAGRHGLGVGFGYITPKDSTVDTGVLPVVNYTYGISSNYSLELSLGKTNLDVKEEGYKLGKITSIPLQLTAQYRIPAENQSLYFGAGVGYYINKFNIGGDLGEDIAWLKSIDPNVDMELDLDNSFGYHINIGTDIFLSKNLAINFDARYLWSKADGTLTFTDPNGTFGGSSKEKERVDLDSFIIAAGVKYFF